jgi:hypothetical protein
VQNGEPMPSAAQNVLKHASRALSSSQVVAAAPPEPALALVEQSLDPAEPAVAALLEHALWEQLARLSAKPQPARHTTIETAFICGNRSATSGAGYTAFEPICLGLGFARYPE